MTSALQHIQVVDLPRTLAGPFCTMLLGDMGAARHAARRPGHRLIDGGAGRKGRLEFLSVRTLWHILHHHPRARAR